MEYFAVLFPSIGVCAFFCLVIRALLNCDKKERQAQALVKPQIDVEDK